MMKPFDTFKLIHVKNENNVEIDLEIKYLSFTTSTATLLHMQRKVSPKVCGPMKLEERVFLVIAMTFWDSSKCNMFLAHRFRSTFQSKGYCR